MNDMGSPIEDSKIRDNLEILAAIETLEYHDKNYLNGDDRRRCEAKRAILNECLAYMNTTAINTIG